MKKLSLLLIAFFCTSLLAVAAPVNKVVKSGNWSDITTWGLNILPRTGDTLLVPFGKTLTVNSNLNLTFLNVYLKIEGTLMLENGKLDLGPNSKVVLVNEDASIQPDRNHPNNKIMIMGVTKYTGAEQTLYGPAYLDGSTNSFTLLAPTTLPVKFIGFSVARSGNGTRIQWSTAEEVNASHFEVERSNDGINWNTTARLQAAGNSTSVNDYSYTDLTPVNRLTYYRIRQVDVDGRFTYTAVKTTTGTKMDGAQVSISTTTTNHVLIQFAQEITTPVQVRIVSLNGQVIAQQEYKTSGSQIVVQTVAAAKGAYVVCLTNGTNLKVAKQVIL